MGKNARDPVGTLSEANLGSDIGSGHDVRRTVCFVRINEILRSLMQGSEHNDATAGVHGARMTMVEEKTRVSRSHRWKKKIETLTQVGPITIGVPAADRRTRLHLGR